MKYFLPILMAVILISCSNTNEINDNPEEVKEDVVADEQEDNEEEGDTAQFHGMHFRLGIEDVKVTGKAKATNDEIFYVIEQGEEQIVEGTKITLEEEEDEWTDLEIKFPLTEEMENSEDALVAILYGKDDHGEQINPNILPINLNMKFYN